MAWWHGFFVDIVNLVLEVVYLELLHADGMKCILEIIGVDVGVAVDKIVAERVIANVVVFVVVLEDHSGNGGETSSADPPTRGEVT